MCRVKPCEDRPHKITPQRTLQHWTNPAKMDKSQLCSVRRFGHRAVEARWLSKHTFEARATRNQPEHTQISQQAFSPQFFRIEPACSTAESAHGGSAGPGLNSLCLPRTRFWPTGQNGCRSARLKHLTSRSPVAESPHGAELTFIHLCRVLCGVLCGFILRSQSSQGLTPQNTPQNKANCT